MSFLGFLKDMALDWPIGTISIAILSLLALGLVVFEVYSVIDHKRSHVVEYKGVVIGRHYTPSSTSTGVGVGSNGSAVVTTSSKSAEYLLEVEWADGGRSLLRMSRPDFMRTNMDEEYLFALQIGGLSNSLIGSWLSAASSTEE